METRKDRLTERNPDGGINVRDLPAALEKLAFYEDAEEAEVDELSKCYGYLQAEEQGRLAQLPCKIGDTVYQIGADYDHRVYESAIKAVIFDTTAGFAFDASAIGNSVFLTQGEAEAALQARNGDGA